MTGTTTVSPSIQAVRESRTTLSIYMKISISKADLFVILIPAERVTVCIANEVLVSNNFTTAITTAHRLPSLQLRQCTRNHWTDSTYSNIHWAAYYRSLKKEN
jgi:hypothetical protein